MILQFLFQIIFLSWPMIASSQESPLALPSCQSKCGNVTIPFPFGMREGCYIDPWFYIECNNSNKPFIKSIDLEVLEISLDGTMRVNHPVTNSCLLRYDDDDGYVSSLYGDLHAESPFVFSQESNKFIGLGCNNIAYMTNMTNSSESIIGGCFSFCDKKETKENDTCYGIKCCQSPIPSFLKVFNATLGNTNDDDNDKECKYAFLVEQNWFQANLTNPQDVKIKNMSHVPVVLDWGIFNSSFQELEANQATYLYIYSSSCEEDDEHFTSSSTNSSIFRCQCDPCKKGNPYLLQGCEDIDDKCFRRPGPKSKENVVVLGCSAGLASFFLLFGAWWLCIILKKRKAIKLKQKFFKQNGGLLLEQQLTSSDGSVDSSKLFNSKELDKATDHFNVNRILGEGGQGTVYKGMLSDGRIVAVKKPKVVDEGKIHEFINEVVILSQINHRNVVKLLGCCLETEVPLLVYEFIPNGALLQYLHQNEEVSLTWNMRLRIAVEVAGALSYLHSAAWLPIYHRDIKSTNILLDEKYRAKVADFGTSRSIAIDQTHVTTKVQGTFGYMDPEFFQSGQFTDKSDVYSFGVVLVELLTGQKPISSTRSGENKNLVTSFIISMEENCLYDILDAHVQKQGKKEDIMAIAILAKRCLNLTGKNRPTMKEVAMVLEGIQVSQKDDGLLQTYQEIEFERTEIFEACDVGSSSTSTFEHVGSSI